MLKLEPLVNPCEECFQKDKLYKSKCRAYNYPEHKCDRYIKHQAQVTERQNCLLTIRSWGLQPCDKPEHWNDDSNHYKFECDICWQQALTEQGIERPKEE